MKQNEYTSLNEDAPDNDDDVDEKDDNATRDSMELNMLPMIKEDPQTNRIYRLSRVQQNQQNMREKHKRSMSMSVVKLCCIHLPIVCI